jgi:amino-acid N-acetyltransferase
MTGPVKGPEIGPADDPSSGMVARRARTHDVTAIKALVDVYAGRVLLAKELITLYEAVQEFWVVELDGRVVGCGALHVLWLDLAEVRTVAVDPAVAGRGIGRVLVQALLRTARELGVRRVFVLTFERQFFGRHGFVEIEGTPVAPEVYEQMRRSYDAGVAEFLDLAYVKTNTLGNARMLLEL